MCAATSVPRVRTRAVIIVDCIKCKAGKYSDEEGLEECKPCPEGKFSAVERAESNTCEECTPGKYIDSAGKESCNLCPAGKYSSKSGATTSSDCVECKKSR